MRIKLKILLFILIFTLFMAGCSKSVQKVQSEPISSGQGEQKPEYVKKVYVVLGMDCPGCHSGLEKLVKQLPAVKKAVANWEKKQLTIYVHPNHKLDDKEVHNAIEKANFTPGKKSKKKK